MTALTEVTTGADTPRALGGEAAEATMLTHMNAGSTPGMLADLDERAQERLGHYGGEEASDGQREWFASWSDTSALLAAEAREMDDREREDALAEADAEAEAEAG